MFSRTRLLLAAALAALALAAGAGSALAELYAISPAGSITDSSLGSITFRSPLVSVTCALTLAGSLERVGAANGMQIGSITSVRGTETCRGATVTADATPWLIVAGAAQGTLPNGLTGSWVELVNAGILFDITFLGVHVKCVYFGVVPSLTPLSGTNPYRTGLVTIQSGSVSLELDRSLDTSGMCPTASEVSMSGTMSATTQTLTASLLLFQETPASPISYAMEETKVFTFRNITAATQRVTGVGLDGSSSFTIVAETCLTEIAAQRTCTVSVRWRNPHVRNRYLVNIRLTGDPSESLIGVANLNARSTG
jgi:hypothetical protein